MTQVKSPLSFTHPDLACEWNVRKNGALNPSDVTIKSQRKVWWQCSQNPSHEWRQVIYRRAFRSCPHCKLEQRSLAKLFPEVASDWHPSKNGDFKPDNVTAQSSKTAWWLCRKNPSHSWQATIGNRTARESGCPYCAGKKADDSNSLEKLRPDIAAEWHPKLNKQLKPSQVTCGSDQIVWWLCKRTKLHEWQSSIEKRVSRGQGCTTCRRVTEDNSLATRFPEIAAQWHPTKNRHLFPNWDPKTQRIAEDRVQKNRRLKPTDVAAFSKEWAWWQCPVSKAHVWYQRITKRTSNNGGCPFCNGVRIAEDNNLAAKYPSVAKLWHPSRNLPLTPDQVTPGTAKIVWWRCYRSAQHVWQASIVKITGAYRNGHSGCPFCVGRKVGPDNNLASKHPEVAKLWHHSRNSPLLPSQVTPGTPNKFWWQCQKIKEHVWDASVSNVVKAKQRASKGCPFCGGFRVAKENSLKAKCPEVAKLWDKSRNLSLLPKQVTYMSNKKVFWRCDKNPEHVWEAKVCSMVTRWNKEGIVCQFCKSVAKGKV